jgi:hypothetical protein
MSAERSKRDRLISAVADLPDVKAIEQGWYVNSSEGEPDPGMNFCREHALIVAQWSSRETGERTWADSHGSAVDLAARCEFGCCDKPLDFGGGLTSYGIDSALALTETDPLRAHIYPAELELSAYSLADDDPRWETWEAQAARVLVEARTCC